MNDANTNPAAFANGFNCFCPDSGVFFSVRHDDDSIGQAEYCPYCGEGNLLTSVDDLLGYCDAHNADPVNFYSAFPPDEPVPHSGTGATPRQVEAIVNLVILYRQAGRPVTVDLIAAEGDIPRKTVEQVFAELHITENGVAA